MRVLKISFFNLDDLGACVSGLCLVHCVSMPLALAFAPTLAHLIPGDEIIHRLFAFLIVGAGVPSFAMGFRKHKKLRVWVLGISGLAVILGVLAFDDRFSSHGVEIAITSVGSLLLTAAHRVNRTFCRRCEQCQH
ncbi:MAG TPA: MerC domain-containing protein [Candidatus Saccharimonadales bacterium]|jgi:hypothetical protein|nr:MerC domain-containing protein [Candidatus Saccharimonadales bacterium]